MTKGHVFLAQNTEEVDYVKQAYALALSIKVFNKEYNQTCLITNDSVPEEYKHAFDHIVPIPWKDSARNSRWKIENRWKIIYATPFDENLVYDTDMLLLKSNDNIWKDLENFNFCFTSNVLDYKGNIVTSNYYRKSFTENNVPSIYTGFFYFKKVKESYEFFKWLEVIVNNWYKFYRKFLVKKIQDFCSIDLSSGLALKFMGVDNPNVPLLTFVHMKPHLQSWNNIPSKCFDVLDYYLNDNLSLIVGNFKQNGLFHYVEKDFLTNDIILKLENAKEKIKTTY
jgi:hypothetical protein